MDALQSVPEGDAKIRAMANAIRGLTMDGVEAAKSGHAGLPMGTADIVTVLYTRFLKFDAANPDWADRDRFVLSAGHGSMLLYSLLYLNGYPNITLDDLKHFRQLGWKTPGHPEHGHTLLGIETTTGPLGQGIATSVGMAMAERLLAAHYPEVTDHYTYVLASDGDLMEGVSHEAIHLAGHYRLSKLIVFWDDNGISIDGPVSLAETGDQVLRFEAAGWNTIRVDGYDHEAIAAAIEQAQKSDKPTMIACKTIIGFGAPTKAGTQKAHSEPLGAEEEAGAKKALGIGPEPFVVPQDVLDAWKETGRRGAQARDEWEKRLAALPQDKRDEFQRRHKGERPGGLEAAIVGLKKSLFDKPQTVATRKASELALDAIVAVMPELILGSADLTPSNNTKAKGLVDISPEDFSGRYIHYGIREHGMAAAMNGMTVHGSFVAAGGTFMCFSDYARPAIRLSALMEIAPVYIMTHDSIGLGEDGPTHQPVEHLAALRAMPNLRVFRPCDAVETAECWQMALQYTNRPTILALSRQNLPQLRHDGEANHCVRGAYELAAAEGGDAVATIFASGSEVQLAVEARTKLAERGIPARVVSVPSLELFLEQPEDIRAGIVGTAPVRVAVEAAVRWGWDAVIGEGGGFVGMSSFGASGKIGDLYKHFGITADAVVDAVVRRHNA